MIVDWLKSYENFFAHVTKLYPGQTGNGSELQQRIFFSVNNVSDKLPAETDFSWLSNFKRTITSMDFSDYLQCF